MKNFKHVIIFLVIIFFPGILLAQWGGSSSIDGDTYRNGSVGIGSSSPTYRFQIVNGDAQLYAIYEGDTQGNGDRLFKISNAQGRVLGINAYHSTSSYNKLITRIGINYSIDGNNSNTQMAINGSKKAPVIELNAEDGSISLFGENGSGGNWRNSGVTMNLGLHVNKDGKVGIGTTEPSNELDVNGTIHTKKIMVDMNGWSDFVFQPSYDLRPLQEVNSYIQQNGHLPEIPTTKEVEENGISLGEMNAKLLQKIEELTLYSIVQQKQIDQLLKTVEKQGSEIEELKNKTY